VIPFIQKEPAAISAAVIAVIQALILFGVVQITVDQLAGLNIALVAVLGLLVRQNTTPTAAPTLAANTEVKVQGTADTVIVQPTPPGPAGVEGGAAEGVG
jgi:hypothetical protein